MNNENKTNINWYPGHMAKAIREINEKIKLEVSDEINNITIYGADPSEAINQPITKENIEKSLTKTGTTPYKVSSLNINISGNLFIRNIDINNLTIDNLGESYCYLGDGLTKEKLQMLINMQCNISDSIFYRYGTCEIEK